MRSRSAFSGFHCNRTMNQDNYTEKVAVVMSVRVNEHAPIVHVCMHKYTLTQSVYKVHSAIKTLINVFLLLGV